MFELFLVISLAIIISDSLFVVALILLGTNKRFVKWYTNRALSIATEMQDDTLREFNFDGSQTTTTNDEEA